MAAADRFREGGMTTRLIIGAVFVGACTWLISWAIGRWADKEAARSQRERLKFDKIMQAGAPRAAGCASERRRVG